MAKKKICIISSTQGGGHKSAACAIQKILDDSGYPSDIVFPVRTGNFYNYIQKYWPEYLNDFVKYKKEFEAIVRTLPFLISNPVNASYSLFISVQPLCNSFYLEECKKIKKKFLVIPTDIQTERFFHGISEKDPHLYVALSWEEMKNASLRRIVKRHNLSTTGYPVHTAFQNPAPHHLVKQFREKFQIKKEDFVICMMLGMQGNSQKMLSKAKIYSRYTGSIPLHFFALNAGRKRIGRAIDEIPFTNHNFKLHVISEMLSAEELSALYESSNFVALDTKPGGASMHEAICKRVFLIFENLKGAPSWEIENMNFAIEKGLGIQWTYLEDVLNKLKQKNTSFFEAFDCPTHYFKTNFTKLINNLF